LEGRQRRVEIPLAGGHDRRRWSWRHQAAWRLQRSPLASALGALVVPRLAAAFGVARSLAQRLALALVRGAGLVLGWGLAPVLPAEALLLELLQHPAQLQPCLLQAGRVGRQAQAQALHGKAIGAVATGQGPPQPQAAAPPLQTHGHAGGGEQGVLLLNRPINGVNPSVVWGLLPGPRAGRFVGLRTGLVGDAIRCPIPGRLLVGISG
jgi:hypothetical protein